MKFTPNKIKHSKPHAPALKTSPKSLRGDTNFERGKKFRLISSGRGFLSPKELEAVRIAIVRAVRKRRTLAMTAAQKERAARKIKKGKKKPKSKVHVELTFYVHCSQAFTKKSLRRRMGKGKGKIHRWVRPVRPGSTILELNLETLENKIRLDAFRTRQFKLSVPTYIV